MTTTGDVGGLLLTGGRSRRMGRDKARLEVDGVTLAVRTGSALRAAVRGPVVEVGPGWSGLPAVVEDEPRGPLVALVGGVHLLQLEGHLGAVLVVAVDLPLVDVGLLRFLAEHPARGSVVPRSGGRAQPLCARWSTDDLDVARRLVLAERRALQDLLAAVDVTVVEPEEWGAAGAPDALDDVDTPEDWDRLAGRARRVGP